MEFLDIHEGLTVSCDKIVALEALDPFTTAIHVDFGAETRVFQKNVSYTVIRDIILARNKETPRQIESSVARNLEQLAKYQQSFAG